MRSGRQICCIVLFVIMSMTLQGCLYPKEMRKESQQSVREGVLLVQNAVDQYQKDTGLLPLVSSDESVPRYEKFRVNFELLKRRDLLSAIPGSAFESGGSGVYLIIDEESTPKVKVMDLVTSQRVNDLARAVDAHIRAKGSVPKQEEVYPGFYRIDEKLIGIQPVEVRSPFSRSVLSFMMDEQGRVYADYAQDIMQLVESSGKQPTGQEDDLRPMLADASFFVPVKSVAYIWSNGAPVPQVETSK
ncbi:hypothetical protein [Paenibacillus alvei]|uniref:Lipoprotein n=1 Tax=Paenibacillus alvei TaxID=44250 RepID=A0A383RC60_PAEAL|nr:hypothetical protein [Paenibacillus alvei]SYX84687.1 conserved protein of unknown function [Paenibacillus alvei]